MYSLCRCLIFALILTGTLLAHGSLCDVLPSDTKAQIQRQFPDLRPKDLADLRGDDRKLWLEAHPKACPGVASGHFEKPGSVTYALLLVPKTGNIGKYRIVVLRKEAEQYAVRFLDEGSFSADSGLVVSREPPGTYSEFDDGKSVHLTLDGVNVEWLEKGSVLYYWSRGKYRTAQTSD